MTNGRRSRMGLFSLGSWLWCKTQKQVERGGICVNTDTTLIILMIIVWAWQMCECDGGADGVMRVSNDTCLCFKYGSLDLEATCFPNVQYYWLLSWKWKTDEVRWWINGRMNKYGELCLCDGAPCWAMVIFVCIRRRWWFVVIDGIMWWLLDVWWQRLSSRKAFGVSDRNSF